MKNIDKIIQDVENEIHASCRRMVKIDSEENLLDRIIRNEVPEFYMELTKQEILKRKLN